MPSRHHSGRWAARVKYAGDVYYLGSFVSYAKAKQAETDFKASHGMTRIESCPECGKTRRVPITKEEAG